MAAAQQHGARRAVRALYLSNWQFIADSRDYFAADSVDASPFLHFWSLSIEEQFYVVLPLALLLLLRLRRHTLVVLLVLSAVVAGSVALQVWYAGPTRRTPTTPPGRGSTSSPPGCCSRWSPGW